MAPYALGAGNDLLTGCASLLRGTGILPPDGVLGLGRPLFIGVLARAFGLAEPDCWLDGGPDVGWFWTAATASCVS